jgi:hypothetical protein
MNGLKGGNEEGVTMLMVNYAQISDDWVANETQ